MGKTHNKEEKAKLLWHVAMVYKQVEHKKKWLKKYLVHEVPQEFKPMTA